LVPMVLLRFQHSKKKFNIQVPYGPYVWSIWAYFRNSRGGEDRNKDGAKMQSI